MGKSAQALRAELKIKRVEIPIYSSRSDCLTGAHYHNQRLKD